MAVTDERLDQLANDPMMFNITLEVQECLRELIRRRQQVKDLARSAARSAEARSAQSEIFLKEISRKLKKASK